MNPFDLNGPQFLVFYMVLAASSYALLRSYVRSRERLHPIPNLKMSDPYQIAYLRGGRNEAIRIATVSLLDRGLLSVTDPTRNPKLTTTDPANIDVVKAKIERAILKLFWAPREARAAFDDAGCIAACDTYSEYLGQHNLVATARIKVERLLPVMLVGVALGAVAIIKIGIALDRGRMNFGLLVVLFLLLAVFLVRAVYIRRTGLGDTVLEDLKKLFASLHNRRNSLRAGGQTAEVALLAAVFGISALPQPFQYVKNLYPRAKNSNCGSGCGFSGCGGGGSGGGGGCGGGGGGCGGCGS